jgi:hypothetical protein
MVLLGAMYFAVYFVIRGQTSSLQYFETIPTYVPACLVSAAPATEVRFFFLFGSNIY